MGESFGVIGQGGVGLPYLEMSSLNLCMELGKSFLFVGKTPFKHANGVIEVPFLLVEEGYVRADFGDYGVFNWEVWIFLDDVERRFEVIQRFGGILEFQMAASKQIADIDRNQMILEY